MYYKSDEGKNLDCMSGGHHLEFVRTGNSAIRSAFPKKPHHRTKHEVDRMTGCGEMAI